MDRIQGIKAFIRVADLGSFSKAARELGVGQPAITKMIAAMEKQVGSRLLHRTTTRITMTEVGALYYEKCRLILHHIEEASNVAALMQSQLQGGLRVSTSVAFGRRVIAPMVMTFLEEHPQIQIDLTCDDRYVNLVEQGIDLAVRMGKLADSTLGARYLGRNPWVIAAAPSYIKAKGAPKKPSELTKHSVLVYSTVQGDSSWQLTGPNGKTETITVSGPLRSNSLSTILAATRAGMGVAALPLYVAHESLKSGAIREVLGEWQLPSQEVHAVFPSPKMIPTKVSVFTSWLQSQFTDHWWEKAAAR
jgi:DNA-binding transcriptional LysR family regulator